MRPVAIKIIRARRNEEKEYAIAIPAWMALKVPAGTKFVPEWTEEGILYRRVELISENPPEWTRANQ